MDTTQQRPGSATLLGFLAYLSAFFQLLTAIAAIFLWLRPGQTQELFNAPVSDWYWILMALLSFFLFFAYIWLGRGIFAGMPYAYTLVNVLAAINLIFGLFALFQGTGLASVLISIIVLALNNSQSVRAWYGTV